MKITFHIGAHRTDEDRLMRSLIRNSQKLADEGIIIPGPTRYREILREVTTRLKGQVANPETTDLVLDSILDTTEADHIVLCHEAFTCAAPMILSDGGYYATAGPKCAWLRNTFPGHEIAFALGIRNPATQVPAVFQTLAGVRAPDFLGGVDPLHLRWSDPIRAIVEQNPGCPVIVWCNEDTPLIWPEVMREVSGHSQETRLKGGFDILYQIMEPEGIKRLRSYLGTHPPQNEIQRRRILAAFLDKYAMEEQIEEDVDFPGWTAELVEAMTEAYEDDLTRVAAIPGVTFLSS
jgi:hypothetical protein